MSQIVELLPGKVSKCFALALEVFVEFDGFFLHHGVCFRAAADKPEVLAGRDADMPVFVVQAQAQQQRLLRLVFLSHSAMKVSESFAECNASGLLLAAVD